MMSVEDSPENTFPQIIIRPDRLDEFFSDRLGRRHRGVMAAYDRKGNIVASGVTYAEFMNNLKSRRID